MDAYSDEDIRQAAEIREWLVKQLADKQEEIEKLRSTLLLIDSLLKQGSFKAASNFGSSTLPISTDDVVPGQKKTSLQSKDGGITYGVKANSTESNEQKTVMNTDSKVIKPLIRFKDSMLLANAEIYPDSVVIIPVKGIILNVNTPPFKSFFLNRILDGMKKKDEEAVNQSRIKESDLIQYSVEEDNEGLIKRIKINNYREKERLNEIFNTSSWVFTRMIEKSG
ncbi:MAG TPA: hypothetical protein VH796_17690 [Nitrososphaeraceae archaeon]|jgi:hypothetical protein